MARVLSFPLRLQPNGRLATVDQDSDAAHADQLAALILTRPGDRTLVPDFGIPDPTFAGFEPSDLVAGVAAFGPPVRIGDVTVAPLAPYRQQVTIEFS